MDVRTARREATRRAIVDAAWVLAERDGLASWTLRDLGDAVGLRAPSLYTHFDGRDAILDAMFAQGWDELAGRLAAVEVDRSDPVATLVAGTETYVDFCVDSVARYQLLFTHVLGDWEPSPEAYAASQRAWAAMVGDLAAVGAGAPEHVDLYTAIGAGLVAQQLANDRGGDRWRRLVPDAVAMFLAHVGASAPSDGKADA